MKAFRNNLKKRIRVIGWKPFKVNLKKRNTLEYFKIKWKIFKIFKLGGTAEKIISSLHYRSSGRFLLDLKHHSSITFLPKKKGM